MPAGETLTSSRESGHAPQQRRAAWTVYQYVVPLSLVPSAKPADQWRVGQALAPLADQGVLLIGSGSLTHNLRRFFTRPMPVDAPEEPDCAAFRAWVHERAAAVGGVMRIEHPGQGTRIVVEVGRDTHHSG